MGSRVNWGKTGLLVIATAPFLYPFVFLIITALKPALEFDRDPIGLPRSLAPQNLSDAWTQASLGPAMLHTVVAVGVAVLVTALISAAGAFWFLRHTGRIAFVLRTAIIATMACPPPVFIIPLFVLLNNWNMTNNLVALGLVYAGWNASFGLYLMDAYYKGGIPPEVLEASQVDGASLIQQFVRIVLPLSTPALATLAALTFVWSWGDLLISVVLVQDPGTRTLMPSVALLADRYNTNIPQNIAGVLLALIPMLLVFLAGQRYLQRGIVAGVTK